MFYILTILLAFFSLVSADSLGRCIEKPPAGLGLNAASQLVRWRRGTEATICLDGTWTDARERGEVSAFLVNARATWNDAKMGVTFSIITNCAYASVVVRKQPSPRGSTVFADCQYPNSRGFSVLNVYDFWFTSIRSGNTQARTTLIHELGHFLGFDHEMDPARSVSGNADSKSVMSYQSDRSFTTRDASDARRYYNYALDRFPGQTITVYAVRKWTPPPVRHCCGRFLGVCYKYCV